MDKTDPVSEAPEAALLRRVRPSPELALRDGAPSAGTVRREWSTEAQARRLPRARIPRDNCAPMRRQSVRQASPVPRKAGQENEVQRRDGASTSKLPAEAASVGCCILAELAAHSRRPFARRSPIRWDRTATAVDRRRRIRARRGHGTCGTSAHLRRGRTSGGRHQLRARPATRRRCSGGTTHRHRNRPPRPPPAAHSNHCLKGRFEENCYVPYSFPFPPTKL